MLGNYSQLFVLFRLFLQARWLTKRNHAYLKSEVLFVCDYRHQTATVSVFLMANSCEMNKLLEDSRMSQSCQQCQKTILRPSSYITLVSFVDMLHLKWKLNHKRILSLNFLSVIIEIQRVKGIIIVFVVLKLGAVKLGFY